LGSTSFRDRIATPHLQTVSLTKAAGVKARREVLVTGGAGYVGSHSCRALQQLGYSPVVVDNLSRGHEWAVTGMPLHRGDVRDREFLAGVFASHEIFAVLHFAAYAYVGESVADPLLYYDNNVGSTLSLLGQMKRHGVRKIVFSSTCSTYGIPDAVPIEEQTPQRPVNPYGRSKVMAEQVLQDMAMADGFQVVSLRYFNAAGAEPDGTLGPDHDPQTRAIPLAIEAAHRQTPFTIFGDDYETPDGSCIRDYVHVTDLAAAHGLALEWLGDRTGGSFDAFNLATGEGHSVFEVASMVETIVGTPVRRVVGPRREGDPPILVASGARAQRELGWTPKHSDLRTIVETADRWHRKHILHRAER
jgi:UDP-arabinose 4-epimerase